ncbi:MAG: cell division protein FtsZ [Bacteroidales bacterium]|nr:cell division protein FtsZ [Bacteroidales bacterium]
MEDILKFEKPKNQSSIIKVLGVGGGGGNAVNHMFNQGITGVDFIVCNTDAQALDMSPVPNKISLGKKGLGAGSVPSVAEKAAIEKTEVIKKALASNTEMLFITAGMGGGTGTGAAPIIARLAKEIELPEDEGGNILVIAIVTLPFSFEGRKRKQQAERGIEELRKYVDAVLIISNDKLRELYGNLGLSEAFKIADNVLLTAARGIAEIITEKSFVNIDFKDVNTVMRNSGVAIMGTGIAEGENRAHTAIEMALSSPLLNDNDIKGTENILLYLSSGSKEISMDEVTEITEYILDEAGKQAEVIWGAGKDNSLGEQISITVVATGFDKEINPDEGKVVRNLYKDNKVVEQPDKEVPLPKPTRPAIEPKENNNIPEEITLISKPNPEEKENRQVISSKTEEEKPEVIRLSLDDAAPEEADKKHSTEISHPVDQLEEPEELIFFERKPASGKTEDPVPDTISKEEKENLEKKALERVERLRQMSIKLKSPGGLSDLESEPAYLRKNIPLSDTKPSEESTISKYTLSEGDDDNASLKSDNTYLHDNVD